MVKDVVKEGVGVDEEEGSIVVGKVGMNQGYCIWKSGFVRVDDGYGIVIIIDKGFKVVSGNATI